MANVFEKSINTISSRLNVVKASIGQLKEKNINAKNYLSGMVRATGIELNAASQPTKSEAERVVKEAEKRGDIDKKTGDKIQRDLGLKEGSLDWLWNVIKTIIRVVTFGTVNLDRL